MEEKKTPGETIIGGIVLLIIGIVLTARSNNYVSYSYSSFSKGDSWSGFGVVLILVALGIIGVGVYRLKDHSEDYDPEPVEDFSERLAQEKKPTPAPAPIPAVAKVEKPIEKKIVYCPYCGTAQKEDYMSCESCGAGRKK